MSAIRLGLVAAGIAAGASGFSRAHADGPCTQIRFETGQSSSTIRGLAPAGDVVCYTMATGRGQTAVLKVISGNNTIFAIDGLVDARDDYSFRTERKTYRILVGQLMRAVSPQAFAISVSVR